MNEETTLPAEMPSDPESTVAPETDAAEATEGIDGALTSGTIYEDLSGFNEEETSAEVVISLEDIQTVSLDNIHASLFGDFLVCGTLIGLALLRNIHGT